MANEKKLPPEPPTVVARPLRDPPPNISLPERNAGQIDHDDPIDDMDGHRPPLPSGKMDRRPKRFPRRKTKGGFV